MYLGGERGTVRVVSCPRTQHNIPGQLDPEFERINHEATASPDEYMYIREMKDHV